MARINTLSIIVGGYITIIDNTAIWLIDLRIIWMKVNFFHFPDIVGLKYKVSNLLVYKKLTFRIQSYQRWSFIIIVESLCMCVFLLYPPLVLFQEKIQGLLSSPERTNDRNRGRGLCEHLGLLHLNLLYLQSHRK